MKSLGWPARWQRKSPRAAGPYVEGQIVEWFPVAYSLPTYGS